VHCKLWCVGVVKDGRRSCTLSVGICVCVFCCVSSLSCLFAIPSALLCAGESISRANYLLFILMMFCGYIFATHLVTAVMYIGFKQSKEKREEGAQQGAATSRRFCPFALCFSSLFQIRICTHKKKSTKLQSPYFPSFVCCSPELTKCLNSVLDCCFCSGRCLQRCDEGCAERCCGCGSSGGAAQCRARLSAWCRAVVEHVAFERVMIVLVCPKNNRPIACSCLSIEFQFPKLVLMFFFSLISADLDRYAESVPRVQRNG
jgi:hypothetical protein